MFKKSNTNYFVLRYDVSGETAGAEDVSLYAEINDTPEFPKEGAYKLEVFVTIRSNSTRQYLVGLIFGEKSWSRAEIERFVDTIIVGQIGDDFYETVKMLRHYSAVIEAHPYNPDEH